MTPWCTISLAAILQWTCFVHAPIWCSVDPEAPEDASLEYPILENISSGARFAVTPAIAPEALCSRTFMLPRS